MPDDWATADTLQSYTPTKQSKPFYPDSRKISVDVSGDLALLAVGDGLAGVFSLSQNKLVQEFSVGAAVTDVLWAGSSAVIATSAGTVKIFENGTETASFSGHAGKVAALSLHPSGEILASVGLDKSYIFYDLSSSVQALQISTTAGTFGVYSMLRLC